MPLCLSPSPVGLCSESSTIIPPPSSSFFAVALSPCHKLVAKAHPGDASAELSCSLSTLSFLKRRPGLRWIPKSSRFVQPSRVFASPIAASRIAQQSGLAEKAKYEEDADVIQVHTIREFDDALSAARSKLVVVEYAASHSSNSRKIYPSMVEMSKTCRDTVFLLVMGDESEETKDLCKRVGIEKVPHFIFYKNKEIIHEEEGIGPDELLGDVLYYGDPDAPILQLHSRKDVDELMEKHAADGKLLVLDVGLKHCGPCVKVYPTFVMLAKKMKETAVFARMNGDENEQTVEFLKQMDVVQVPTFLFIKDGKISGRYVGSGKGELIGEILRYLGVRVLEVVNEVQWAHTWAAVLFSNL